MRERLYDCLKRKYWGRKKIKFTISPGNSRNMDVKLGQFPVAIQLGMTEQKIKYTNKKRESNQISFF